ncbi:glycosyltransferase family 4 protein [Candidatus Contendibacter odensensis]|uniref:Phosphatidylinositol alpha-1,6-mannosyltransferase n=1 Tax=Candidatus Contendobacter odensis Run_B_J11 TaxID=1400861 RepID=A0A7U7G7F2_9GAMM|nr:glycosyltransferase family 4 protein [Candidatus Contendobacter odensis]CDH43054.1 conserved hypothetical protein [Candidatus Contendobacter odensis Run_B_J11]
MKTAVPVRCLLIASIFPPIHGGSAVVYESLCRYVGAGSIFVLAPWRHYIDGQAIAGWREYDAQAGYPVERIELLRPLMLDIPCSRLQSVWRTLTIDLPLKWRVLKTVAALVRRERINVVCIGELTSGSWIGLAAQRLLGCRMINYIHGEEITTETTYRFYGRQRHRYLAAADAVVAVSEFTRAALTRLMGVPREKIELIPNGVDLERFSAGPRNAELLRRLGVRDGEKVILTVGRLVPRKGMDMVLRALPAIRQSIPSVHYLIVGEGEYRPVLEGLMSELGLRDCATLAGKLSHQDLLDLYRSCDVFAMPNREMPDGDTEGFGLVFLEANACGRAVIGGRAGGAVEAVRDGENGVLVDGNDPASIADAILRILTDAELREHLERRGLEIALQSSCAERARQFHALCARLVNQG